MENALNHGSVRTVTFKEGDTWYGVALEFNIVVDGRTAGNVMLSLKEAIDGYLESLRKSRHPWLRPEEILNQTPDPEYELLWRRQKGERLAYSV